MCYNCITTNLGEIFPGRQKNPFFLDPLPTLICYLFLCFFSLICAEKKINKLKNEMFISSKRSYHEGLNYVLKLQFSLWWKMHENSSFILYFFHQSCPYECKCCLVFDIHVLHNTYVVILVLVFFNHFTHVSERYNLNTVKTYIYRG